MTEKTINIPREINIMTLLSIPNWRSVIYSLYILILWSLFAGCENNSESNNISHRQTQIARVIFDSIIGSESLSDQSKMTLVSKVTIDSIHSNLIFDLSYHYYKNGDSLQFRYWNNNTLILGINNKKIKGEAHWDLGNFFHKENIIDSSYFHYYRSYKLYSEIGDEYHAARMMLNMGIVQENVKDYIGSEVATIKAIKVFESLDKKKQQYIAYSNLGIVSNGLDQYDNAIKYHQKAISIADLIVNLEYKATSLNNLGVVFENKKNYDSAVYHYDQALKIDKIAEENPKVYAMLLDNLAYSKFKMGPTTNYIDLSKKALSIRDSIGHASGQLINKLHLAEMEQYRGNNDIAVRILTETLTLAKETNNFDYLLEALIKLSEVKPNSSTAYFETYQQLNDSLLRKERLVRNKFAKIRYETNEYIEENKLLSQQQYFLGSLLIVILILAILLFYQKTLRTKNRELLFEKEQQATNEKIYGLIINEQSRMEEAKGQERHRISGDLHDGILGKLFATRISLSLLGHKFLSGSPENKIIFDDYMSEIQIIEKEIRGISHDLKSDLNSDQDTFLQLIEELLDKTRSITGMQIQSEVDRNIHWEQIANNRLIHLYRILQEALQNAIKHSYADKIIISFIRQGEEIKLLIKDDGIGFKKNKKNGIGLKNMQNRVEKLNGKLHIESTAKGVSILIFFPTIEPIYER